MGILWVMMVMAMCGQMAKFGHLATFGHSQHDPKYGNDGYPRKEHEKTNSPVKFLSDLDVWLKSFGQNKKIRIFPYVSIEGEDGGVQDQMKEWLDQLGFFSDQYWHHKEPGNVN